MKTYILPVLFLLMTTQTNLLAFQKDIRNESHIKKIFSGKSTQDTARVNELIRKGSSSLSMKKSGLEDVRIYIDSAINICKRKNYEIPTELWLLKAQYNFARGDQRNAFEDAEQALKSATEKGERKLEAKTYLFLGEYYRRTGLFQESLEDYANALSIGRKEKMERIVPLSYLGQANVYNTINDINGFRKNLELMIEAAGLEMDSVLLIGGYHRLGTSYLGDTVTSEHRNFRLGDSILRKSLAVSERKADTAYIALTTANLGWNYYLEKMYDSSLYWYEKSLKYSIPGRLYPMAANSLGNLGTIYRDLGQNQKAIDLYRKGIHQASLASDLYELWWIHRDMSELYLRSGDTSKAFRNYVLFKRYSDEYNRGMNSQGLADARMRYEADTHNKEVELLSLRLKNNRLLNFGFAGLVFLTIITGFLISRESKLKNKRRISEMNHKISELSQANLRQQMNPHFIFNTLNSIQYYMYQHDKIATNNYLTKFSSLMRKVLENSRHTSIPLSDELSALNLYLELETIRFKDKFTYSISIDEEIDPLMYKVPTMLIQPYVENSISHGLIPMEGKGIVRIDLTLQSGFILCTIEDNGIGREAARERSRLREENHNSLGTQITASRLDLVNELYGTSLRVEYTDLRNEKGEPDGTKVEIHIPIIS